jgi:hypothetical protein
LLKAAHDVQALVLERLVAHCEYLIDQQDVRFGEDRHCESEAHEHTAGVELHGGVDELLDPTERDDLIEAATCHLAWYPEDVRVEEHVLPTGQIVVEARPEFQKGRKGAASAHLSLCRCEDPTDDL